MLKILDFPIIGDERGSLISLEEYKNIPFSVKRVYYIFDTMNDVSRGFHAHKNLEQVLICVKGSCRVVLDDGKKRAEVVLDKPNQGLYVDNNKWREMHDFSSDCVLLVLASDVYNEKDYIRNYEEFLSCTK